MIIAGRHPQISCTSCDLPVVRPIAERAIAAAGMKDRVSAAELDFLTQPIPPADVVTMGLILHDWNLESESSTSCVRHTTPCRREGRSSWSRTSSTTRGVRTSSV